MINVVITVCEKEQKDSLFQALFMRMIRLNGV